LKQYRASLRLIGMAIKGGEMSESAKPYPVDEVIRTIRGHKVILDTDLARVYGVETKNLNKAFKRNSLRFP
jgi:hypothetical protein